MEIFRMDHRWTHLPKPLAAAAGSALIVAFAFGGLVAAHTLPRTPASDHASATAKAAAADANQHAVDVLSAKTSGTTDTTTTTSTTDTTHPTNHGAAVSAVAQDATLVGGPHDNHGWYVSCVARGMVPDVTVTPNTCKPAPAAATTTSSSTKSHGKSGTHGAPPHFGAPVSPVAP